MRALLTARVNQRREEYFMLSTFYNVVDAVTMSVIYGPVYSLHFTHTLSTEKENHDQRHRLAERRRLV